MAIILVLGASTLLINIFYDLFSKLPDYRNAEEIEGTIVFLLLLLLLLMLIFMIFKIIWLEQGRYKRRNPE